MKRKIRNMIHRLEGKYYYTEGDELPDDIERKQIFIGGKFSDNWVLVMKCPCGCGDKIYLNTLKAEKPFWTVEYGKKGISVYPSIWRKLNCKSHFFVRKGKIEWAGSFDDWNEQ